MSNTGLVAWHESRLNVFNKSFIIVLLSVPLMILMMIVLVRLLNASENNNLPLGYIDHSGLLENPQLVNMDDESQRIQLIAYTDQNQARSALDSGQIQAFYVLAADYLASGKVELVFRKQPGESAMRQFADFLQLNLMAAYPNDIMQRTALGSRMNVVSLQDGRVYPNGDPTIGMAFPLILGVAFIGLFMTGSGYLQQAAYTERENRTIEMLATSISPREIVTGKVLGVVAINFIQFIFWMLIAGLALFIGRNMLAIPWMMSFQIEPAEIVKLLLIAVPSYVVVNALMFAIGWIIGKPQDSEPLGPLVFAAHLLPIYLFPMLGSDPGSTIILLMNLLPVTSVFAFGIRSLLIIVPWWQVAISFVIQSLAAFAALNLAARAFRLGWLRYGANVSIREILSSKSVPEVQP